MCVVSMIIDDYTKKYPFGQDPNKWPYTPPQLTPSLTPLTKEGPSKEDFEKLRKEMEELKKLIKAGMEFDKNTGQPDCEKPEKVELLKQLGKYLGVSMDDLFEPKEHPLSSLLGPGVYDQNIG